MSNFIGNSTYYQSKNSGTPQYTGPEPEQPVDMSQKLDINYTNTDQETGNKIPKTLSANFSVGPLSASAWRSQGVGGANLSYKQGPLSASANFGRYKSIGATYEKSLGNGASIDFSGSVGSGGPSAGIMYKKTFKF